MKIKFTQSVYVLSEDRVFNVGDELKIDEVVGKDLIKANMAIEIKPEEKKVKSTRKTKAADL
jgi:hypothetical protein